MAVVIRQEIYEDLKLQSWVSGLVWGIAVRRTRSRHAGAIPKEDGKALPRDQSVGSERSGKEFEGGIDYTP